MTSTEMPPTLSSKALTRALTLLGRNIGPSRLKPILGCVFLSTDMKGLGLRATNLEQTLTIHVPWKDIPCDPPPTNPPTFPPVPEWLVSLVIDHAPLYAFCNSIRGDCPLTLKEVPGPEDDDGYRAPVALSCATSRTTHTFPVIHSPADFPPAPPAPATRLTHIPADLLADALRATLPSVATESTRYAINGLRYNPTADGIDVAATDGRRLALHTIRVKPAPDAVCCILPATYCTGLLRILTANGFDDTPVAIGTFQPPLPEPEKGKKKPDPLDYPPFFTASTPSFTYATACCKGRFPKYAELFPRNLWTCTLTDSAGDLLNILSELRPACTIDDKCITFSLPPCPDNQGSFLLTAGKPPDQVATADLLYTDASPVENRARFGLNPGYLEDALRLFNKDTPVQFALCRKLFAGPHDHGPVLLTSPDYPDTKFLLMTAFAS